MRNYKLFILLVGELLCFLRSFPLFAQSKKSDSQKARKEQKESRGNLITLGVEPSLLFPTGLFGSAALKAENPNYRTAFSLRPLMSYRAGLGIRLDAFKLGRAALSNQFSLATGLFYSQRRWQAVVENKSNPENPTVIGKDEIRFISYEMPLLLQLHLQAGEKVWFSAGTGMGVEFFPSHAYVPDAAAHTPPEDGYWLCYLARKNLFVPAFKMHLGAEWRTLNAGYLYAGLSYHQPLPRMGDAFWRADVGDQAVHPYATTDFPAGHPDLPMRVGGSWFSLDLKYFFKPSRTGTKPTPFSPAP